MDISQSGSRHCYVVGCANGDYRRLVWYKKPCSFHGIQRGTPPCNCIPPFQLHPFPSKKLDPEGRQRWLKTISRADPQKLQNLLEPKRGHRVCSDHFVDGQPTLEHPDPELNLGHKRPACTRNINREERLVKRRKRKDTAEESNQGNAGAAANENSQKEAEQDGCEHNKDSPSMFIGVRFIIFILLSVIRKLRGELSDVKKENSILQRKLKLSKSGKQNQKVPLVDKLLATDSDTLFYTGIPSISTFNIIHDYICRFVRRRWKGTKLAYSKVRKFTRSPKKFGPKRSLGSRSELLLTLMKLRLGCMTKDLAKRFEISIGLTSQIFHAWLTALSKVLGHLCFWPSKEAIISTMPQRYKKLPGLRAIIDCSEVFIETPKDLKLQSITWSDYKHHNTGKFLIAVAPNSCITFVSPVYGGRASDKAITIDCGFLDLLDKYDLLQADKGFNIQDECAARLITLHIPPGKRGHSQMSSAAVEKTSRVANLRILVEQVIRRLKTFRILKTELPITLVPCVDKIVSVCVALCNLRDPIYKC